MLETTIAGSLPKPAWLAEPRMLWAPWRLQGEALDEAKRDATLLALKLQEDAGIDIVSDGEQARQHFVHGFLEGVEGIDFARRVRIGIRNNRYEALVPTVTGKLRRSGAAHAWEAGIARRHTSRRLKFTLPGPMTIVDTVADAYYGDRVAMALMGRYRLALFEPPYPSPPFELMSLWHREHGDQAAVAWLRGVLREISAEL